VTAASADAKLVARALNNLATAQQEVAKQARAANLLNLARFDYADREGRALYLPVPVAGVHLDAATLLLTEGNTPA
jgi:hypothetical protein